MNITCVAVGSPMPYVKWMLGAEDLTPEDDMPIGRNVLELTDVRQSANYTCVAMSTLGVIEAMAQITVKGKRQPERENQREDTPPQSVGKLKVPAISVSRSVIFPLRLQLQTQRLPALVRAENIAALLSPSWGTTKPRAPRSARGT